jgi:hypothetical protein
MDKIATQLNKDQSTVCTPTKSVSTPTIQRTSSSEEKSTPPDNQQGPAQPIQLTPFSKSRKVFGKEPEQNSKGLFRGNDNSSPVPTMNNNEPILTEFCEWSALSFAQPSVADNDENSVPEEVKYKRSEKAKRLVNKINTIQSSHLKLGMYCYVGVSSLVSPRSRLYFEL